MIISPDAKGRIDPVVYDIIKHINSPIPLVPITRLDDFRFNEKLNDLKERGYVLLDFSEYGWNWDMSSSNIFGAYKFLSVKTPIEWRKFNSFVYNSDPLICFKRELLKRDVSYNVKPIEYPCHQPIPEIDTKEQFNRRVLEVFNGWGLSHEDRKRVHGEIWQKAGKYGYVVGDNIQNIMPFVKEEKTPHRWLTVNIPHYARFSMDLIMEINRLAKISCSWHGAGTKCFRMTEASANSCMVMWEDEIAYTYEWIHGVNCIRVEKGKEIEGIVEALNNPNLYEMYLNCVETCKKYELHTYIKNYIEPTIKNAL